MQHLKLAAIVPRSSEFDSRSGAVVEQVINKRLPRSIDLSKGLVRKRGHFRDERNSSSTKDENRAK